MRMIFGPGLFIDRLPSQTWIFYFCLGINLIHERGNLLDIRADEVSKVINVVSLCDWMARRSLKSFYLKPFVIC